MEDLHLAAHARHGHSLRVAGANGASSTSTRTVAAARFTDADKQACGVQKRYYWRRNKGAIAWCTVRIALRYRPWVQAPYSTGERVRGLVWSRTRYIIHIYIYIQAQWMISSQMAGILRSRAVGVFRVYRVALRVRYRHGTSQMVRFHAKHVRYTAE